MGYEYLDDATTADVAFRVREPDLPRLLASAADALMNVMVEDLGTIAAREERTIAIAGEPADLLLFELLQRLIYHKDAESLLLRVADVQVRGDGDTLALTARARGEPVDPERHELNVDVKAVTLHRFAVDETPDGWEAFVIVDV